MDDRRLVKAMKALADARRFRMMQEVAAAGEISCGQLGERFPLSQPTISHHLKILSDAGLLQIRYDAQHHFVSVNREVIEELAGALPLRLSALAIVARRRRPAV